MAVGPQIAIVKRLADLNLAVRYGIAIRIITCKYEILADFNLAVARQTAKTAKFSGYNYASINRCMPISAQFIQLPLHIIM